MDFTCLHHCKHEVWLDRQLPDSSPYCFSYLPELHTCLSLTILAHSSFHLQVEWGMEVIISSPFRCSCLFGLSVHWDVCLYLCHSIGWGKTLIFTNLQDAQRWEGSCKFCSSEMNMGTKSTRGEHVCASTRTGCVERFTDETWCCHSSAYQWEIALVSLSISPPSLLIFILITW